MSTGSGSCVSLVFSVLFWHTAIAKTIFALFYVCHYVHCGVDARLHLPGFFSNCSFVTSFPHIITFHYVGLCEVFTCRVTRAPYELSSLTTTCINRTNILVPYSLFIVDVFFSYECLTRLGSMSGSLYRASHYNRSSLAKPCSTRYLACSRTLVIYVSSHVAGLTSKVSYIHSS